jgi:hypothetical protein
MEADYDHLRTRSWLQEVFTPRDSIVYDDKGRRTVKQGGWDHEHCLVCRVTISDKSETHWWGYSDDDDQWLCAACYARHVGPVRQEPPLPRNRRSRPGQGAPRHRRER